MKADGATQSGAAARWPLLGAELALLAMTIVAIVGMRRLFADWSYLVPALIAGAGSHGLAMALRRARWPLGPAALASFIAMLFVVALTRYADTLWLIIPSLDTWRAAATELGDAWTAFGEVDAPAEVIPGFIAATMLAVWLLAFIADAAAFRIRTAVEAIAPGFIVVVFTSMLGIEDHRLTLVASFIGVAVLFTLLLRIAHPIHPSVPITATRHRQAPAVLKAGVGLGVAAMAIAVVFGPVLPGVDSDPVVDWEQLDGSSGPRVTLSPLVDARGRLVSQSSTELFRVKADRPAYWRVSGLDRFTGAVWGSDQSYAEATGSLGTPRGDQPDDLLTQDFTITGLDNIWLPAAFEPTAIDGDNISWNAESATLVARRGNALAEGSTYRVISRATLPTRDELISASPVVPADIAARYTVLPEDFSPRITQLAVELTADAPTTYEKALALQNHFLQNFEYSLDVSNGHGGDRMESFLFDDNRGYCEQFSGTFAAMARSIGIPTRVAVGFTPGELVGDEYIVRGQNYHAWPEVWIDGQWVYFEPTPGRGAPGAQGYTGVAEQQEAPIEGIEDEAGGGLVVPQVPAPVIEENFDDLGGLGEEPQLEEPAGGVAPWVKTTGLVILAAIVLAGLWLLLVPMLARLRRQRRAARAADERERIEAAWADLLETLQKAGVSRRPAETHAEFARRAGQRTRVPVDRYLGVAAGLDDARFGPVEPSADERAQLVDAVRSIETDLLEGMGWQERISRAADPRTLVNSGR